MFARRESARIRLAIFFHRDISMIVLLFDLRFLLMGGLVGMKILVLPIFA